MELWKSDSEAVEIGVDQKRTAFRVSYGKGKNNGWKPQIVKTRDVNPEGRPETSARPDETRGTYRFLSSRISMCRPPTVIAYLTVSGLRCCAKGKVRSYFPRGQQSDSSGCETGSHLCMSPADGVQPDGPDHLVGLHLLKVVAVAFCRGTTHTTYLVRGKFSVCANNTVDKFKETV